MKGRLLLLAAVIAVSGTVLVAQTSAMATPKLNGTVGPGFTITLKRADGTIVRRVQHGRHTFVIRDRSSIHNFHLFGPSVDRRTGVAFTGRRRWSVRLRTGTYRYRCDPHRTTMRGRFTVV